jgi:sulfite reductase (NADPH) flavoprotein alpha-component
VRGPPLDLAWSRDGASKVYVQDRLREAGAEAWAWLQGGAHVYVCGDAKGMAPGVHAALLEIAREHGGLDADGADAWLRGLEAADRYHRDVY